MNFNIDFEGMDHCGKTTLIKSLLKYGELRRYDKTVTITSNCYKPDGKYTEKLDHQANVDTFLDSYIKGRLASAYDVQFDEIRVNLIDRGFISTFLYGWLPWHNFDVRNYPTVSLAKGKMIQLLLVFDNYVSANCDMYFMTGNEETESKITFLLRTSDEVSMKDIKNKRKKVDLSDSFEQESFQETVRANYNFFCDFVVPLFSGSVRKYYLHNIHDFQVVDMGKIDSTGSWQWSPVNVTVNFIQNSINAFYKEYIEEEGYSNNYWPPVIFSTPRFKTTLVRNDQTGDTNPYYKKKEELEMIIVPKTMPEYFEKQPVKSINKKIDVKSAKEVEVKNSTDYIHLISAMPIYEGVEYDREQHGWKIKFSKNLMTFEEGKPTTIYGMARVYNSTEELAKEVYEWACREKTFVIDDNLIFIESDGYTTYNTSSKTMTSKIMYE